jgi:hypothetical protein
MHQIKDANNATLNFKSSEESGEKIPHVKVDGGATEAKQDVLNAKDFATQTTLAAILAKLIAAPATEAKQDLIIAALTTLLGYTDGMESLLTAIQNKIIAAPATEAKQDAMITAFNSEDFATQTTLAAILAKLITAPATEAKQDALNAKDFATQTTLAAILAKLIAAPATEAKQDALNAKDFATQTTLAALLNKLPAQGNASPSASMPVNLSNDVTFDASAAAGYNVLNTDLLTGVVSGWYDARAFHSASFHIIGLTGISAGQIIFEQTNDTANNGVVLPVIEDPGLNANPLTAAFAVAASASRMFTAPITAAYVRVRISTAFTGGNVRCVATFSELPWAAMRINIQQAVAANFASTVSGTVTANIGTGSLAAGTNAIGDVGQQYRANASGASTTAKIVSAATTNATNLKASAGRIIGWQLSNTTASWQFVKIHNQTTAPTPGASVFFTIAIPPNGKSECSFEGGIGMGTGIGYTIVTGAADTDTTATTLNAVVGSIQYA